MNETITNSGDTGGYASNDTITNANTLFCPSLSPENKVTAVIVDKEMVRIEKNSKGYNWELKLYPKEGKTLLESDFERLRAINSQMQLDYGTGAS